MAEEGGAIHGHGLPHILFHDQVFGQGVDEVAAHERHLAAGQPGVQPPLHADGVARMAVLVLEGHAVGQVYLRPFQQGLDGVVFDAVAVAPGVFVALVRQGGGVVPAFNHGFAAPLGLLQDGDGVRRPAGVGKVQAAAMPAKVAQFQPHGQGAHPRYPHLVTAGKLVERGLVLVAVLVVMRAQVLAGMRRVGRVPAHGVEFVVAHQGHGGPGVAHGAHDLERFEDLRASVDVVAEEDGDTVGMFPHAALLQVAEAGKKGFELVRTAVDITYDVVTVQHGILPEGSGGRARASCRGTAVLQGLASP